jgi:hypothetical protein
VSDTTADDEYIEAILVWSDQGPSPEVESWLHAHGFETMEMAAGLLVTGTRRQFAAAFGVDPLVDERPLALPVPNELRDKVVSIMIGPPRRIY